MSWSLLSQRGQRKYLTASERTAFINAALKAESRTSSFCLTLALTGARISEVLALTPDRIDVGNSAIILETLKRRQKGIFRAVPVPKGLMHRLVTTYNLEPPTSSCTITERLWPFSRPTAWKRVKKIMETAGVPAHVAKPRALRHAFGVEAVRQRIALSLIRKWLGHSRIETTAIYAEPIGDEERALARLMWMNLPSNLHGSD